MSSPRIYADFNAIEHSPGTSFVEMPLTGFGTLASLAQQGLRLYEGMTVVLFEPNDIECEATVHFDATRNDPAGRPGEWVARFNSNSIRDNLQSNESFSENHPCAVCGKPFYGSDCSRSYTDTCINCGANIMYPMLQPDKSS